jgi:AcrR family transcriptional regulator
MRKQPQQSRSRATVEAIVQAGIQVLGRHGWAGFTTNRVAAVAGVSIGSLYQYFPDKRALVAAIRLRHFDEVLAVVDAAAAAERLPERIERLVAGMLAVHSVYPELHRAIVDEAAGDPAARAAHVAFERAYWRGYRRLLGRARTGEQAAFVLSAAIEGVVHDAARRGVLRQAATQAELTRLALAYVGCG